MNYITNASAGSGIIKYESYIIPFVNEIQIENLLYLLNSTKPEDFIR